MRCVAWLASKKNTARVSLPHSLGHEFVVLHRHTILSSSPSGVNLHFRPNTHILLSSHRRIERLVPAVVRRRHNALHARHHAADATAPRRYLSTL